MSFWWNHYLSHGNHVQSLDLHECCFYYVCACVKQCCFSSIHLLRLWRKQYFSHGNNFGEVAAGTRWHLVYRVTMRELLSCHKHDDKTAALLFVFISYFQKMLILFYELVVKVKTVHMATVSMRWQQVSAVNSSEWLACEKYCIRPPWNSHSCTVQLMYGSYCVNRLVHV